MQIFHSYILIWTVEIRTLKPFSFSSFLKLEFLMKIHSNLLCCRFASLLEFIEKKQCAKIFYYKEIRKSYPVIMP
jgi:hypothetical protein